MGIIKKFDEFICEWADDFEYDAQTNYENKISRKYMEVFVNWAKSQEGLRNVVIDERGYVADNADIDGTIYSWIETGTNDSGWNNWYLDVWTGKEWNSVAPNTAYKDVIDFKEWNKLFTSMYTDYSEHPIFKGSHREGVDFWNDNRRLSLLDNEKECEEKYNLKEK